MNTTLGLLKQEEALQVYETVGKTWTMAELMDTGEGLPTKLHVLPPGEWQGIPPAVTSGSGLSIGPIGEHIDIVINGKAGTAMQAFASQLNPQKLPQ